MTIANGLSGGTIGNGGTLNRASIDYIPISERLVVGRTKVFTVLPIINYIFFLQGISHKVVLPYF